MYCNEYNNICQDQNIDNLYQGYQQGYSYEGYGHYTNNNLGPGIYAEYDLDGNIVWHEDM